MSRRVGGRVAPPLFLAVAAAQILIVVAVAYRNWGRGDGADVGRANAAAAAAVLAAIACAAATVRLARSLPEAGGRGNSTGAPLDGAVDWVFAIDVDGRVVSSDAGVNMLLGYTTDEIVGSDSYRLIHFDDREAARRRVLRSIEDRIGWNDWVLRMTHRDGSERWVQSYATPTVNEVGRVVGFRGSVHDVTSAVLAERADVASRDGLGAKRGRIQAILRDPTSHLRVVFQPIVSMDGTIAGVEALARFAMQPARTPDRWFAEANEVGLGVELELLAVELAITHLDELPDGYLAVNLSPTTVVHPRFRELMARPAMPRRRLVVELTEHVPVDGYDELRAVLDPLRISGLRLAIDDAGAGYSSLRHILELRPDLIKLDRAMVVGISEDAARRVLASALVDVARLIGASVVAEGVEDLASLNATRVAGITLAQGFLFGMPDDPPITLHDAMEGSGHRVIVIDDDPVVRLLVSRMARRAGIEVVGQASDGEEGLRLAERLEPDVIVLDLNMPVMGGEAALPELRRLLPTTFIVVLSATADVDVATNVVAAGADAYVGKDEAATRLPEVFATVLTRPLPAAWR